jgi:hypothetical protein
MKHIKSFKVFESVPQDGFHNKFFKDPKPGSTNFTEIMITTTPSYGGIYAIKGEPGTRSNPSVEVIELNQPLKFQHKFSKIPQETNKLYVYKIHYSGGRYANSEFPNQMDDNIDKTNNMRWQIKYDNDSGRIFSGTSSIGNLYPLADYKGKIPEVVYDYFDSYKGEDPNKKIIGLDSFSRGPE